MGVGPSLLATLGLDSARFRTGLDQSGGRLKNFRQSAVKNFNAVGAAFGAVTAALGTKALLDNADAQIKAANAAGFNFENYQRLRFGYEQAGISGDAFDKAIVKLNKNIVDGERGLSTALDNFSDLNVSFEDLQKLTPEERLIAVQDALNNVEDPGRRAKLASDLLGKSFGSTAVSIDDVVSAGEGLVPITEAAAAGAEESNDAFNRLQTNLGNLTTNVLGPLVTPLTSVVEAFSNFTQEHPRLTQLGIALGAVGAAVAVIGGPITAVAAGITAAIVVWQNWDKITEKVSMLWNKLGEEFPVVQEIIRSVVAKLALPFKNLADIFSGFFNGVQEIFKGNFVAGIKTIINGFVEAVANAVEVIPFIGEDAAKSFREKFIFQLEETKADALDRSPIPELVDGVREKMSELPEIGDTTGRMFKNAFLQHLNEVAMAANMTLGDALLNSTKKLQSGLSDLGKYSKEAFELSKGLALGTSIVDTYRAFNAALAGPPGPPFSYAIAAGALASGLANVANIRSQTFQGRRMGGQVNARQPYIVGESGPELFVPDSAGDIQTNGQLQNLGGTGGKSIVYQPTIQVGPNVGGQRVAGTMNREFMQVLNNGSQDLGGRHLTKTRRSI